MKIPFSYIITFISLIYGLSLTHALSCIAEHIQHRKKIQHYWVWWIWALFILLIAVGFWISIFYNWHDQDFIDVRNFCLLAFQSFLFYLMVFIYFNHFGEIEKNNLRVEFYKYKRLFFIMLSIQFSLIFYILPLFASSEISFNSFKYILKNRIPLLELLFIALSLINNKYFHSIIAFFIIVLALLQFLSG